MTRREKVSPNVSAAAERVIAPERALVPATVQLNEQRVAGGFWPKIGRVAARVPFAREALAVWHCARDPETPTRSKGIMLAALAYFVVPTDVIPDVILGLGFTDDAAVFAALIAVVGRNLKPRHREAAQRDLDRLLDQ
jgi:uncharacterized membrane protein YkvA (DUF1232 family)